MDVQVGHCLAGSRAIVDADVVAVGPVPLGNPLFCPVEKGKQRRALEPRHLKKRPDMALWNDQAMAISLYTTPAKFLLGKNVEGKQWAGQTLNLRR